MTGIKAEWNAPGGAVYHSVAWLSQEEKIIRKLVIHALEGKLQNNVTSAITSSDSKLGFQVDFDRLNQFDFDKSLSLEGDKASKIDMSVKNTQELKDKLAIELTKNCLPESNGFLVVVSDFVSEPFLKEVKVWRGLTSRSEHYDWDEDLPKKKAISIHPPSSLPTQEAPSNPTMQPNPIQESDRFIAQPKKKILGLVLFVMGMLVGMVIGLMLALSFLGAKLPVLPVSQPAQEKQTLNQSNQNFLKSLPSLENQAPSQMNPPAPNQIDQTLIDQFQQIPQRVEPFGKELINQ